MPYEFPKVRFSYHNEYGTGSFLLSEVSDWVKRLDVPYADIRMKNGHLHALKEAELLAFIDKWGVLYA